jgi:peroxiredoxin
VLAATVTSVLGLLMVLGAWLHYLWLIPQERVPREPTMWGRVMVAGVGLQIVAVPLALGLPTLLMLTAGGVLAVFFFYVLSQRHTPAGRLVLRVGDPMPPLRAVTASGEPWSSEAWAGHRVVFKLFRGQWCPYCSAELRRFDSMGAELASQGIKLVAISGDTPAQARAHQQRDGLKHVQLLCDPELALADQLGALHRGAITMSTFCVAGIPLGYPTGFNTVAVPTTIVVERDGALRWIDQTDDYRLRSDGARVRSALALAFGDRQPEPAPW